MLNKYKVNDIIQKKHLRDGIYNGVVKDNKDPLKLNRVRIEIEELTKGIPKEKLPWYCVKNSVTDTPNAGGKIPPINSNVIVEFPDNDIYNGLVSWQLVSKGASI